MMDSTNSKEPKEEKKSAVVNAREADSMRDTNGPDSSKHGSGPYTEPKKQRTNKVHAANLVSASETESEDQIWKMGQNY